MFYGNITRASAKNKFFYMLLREKNIFTFEKILLTGKLYGNIESFYLYIERCVKWLKNL